MIRRLDRRGRIVLTDINAVGFDPGYYGTDRETLMGSLRGRLPDGRWVEGVEVMRRVYEAVGLRWLVAPTRLPGIRQGLAAGYRVFAKNRLWLTGRCEAACGTNVTSETTSEEAYSKGAGI